MPDTPVSRFRISEVARRRLKAASAQTGIPETQLLEIAIANLRAATLRGEGVKITVPEDPDDGPKTHKRRSSAA